MSSPQPSFFSFKSLIENPKMEVRNNYACSYYFITIGVTLRPQNYVIYMQTV